MRHMTFFSKKKLYTSDTQILDRRAISNKSNRSRRRKHTCKLMLLKIFFSGHGLTPPGGAKTPIVLEASFAPIKIARSWIATANTTVWKLLTLKNTKGSCGSDHCKVSWQDFPLHSTMMNVTHLQTRPRRQTTSCLQVKVSSISHKKQQVNRFIYWHHANSTRLICRPKSLAFNLGSS